MDSSNSASRKPAVLPNLGLAVTSLVFGILSLVSSFLVIGVLAGLVGLTGGIIHLRRTGQPRGLAISGLVLSISGIVAGAGFFFFYYATYQKVRAFRGFAAPQTAREYPTWEGKAAPDITVTALDGHLFNLSQLKGKRVVVNRWATWCGACVREVAHFNQLRKTAADDLVVIGISDEEPSVLRTFAKKAGVSYPISSGRNLPEPYSNVSAIPTTFFIDREGVIRSVLVGYRDFDVLKRHALSAEDAGTLSGSRPLSSTNPKDHDPLKPVVAWTNLVPGARAMCVGDWDGDGTDEVLVVDSAGRLHVIAADGRTLETVQLAQVPAIIELGRNRRDGPRLLGYRTWGHEVCVFNRFGKLQWTYAGPAAVDGAHWGDLDGDGTDELIVGLNGRGGLHALSPNGTLLWQATNIGNVWNQAVVSATDNRDARVFVTESSGAVRVYDGAGSLLNVIRPRGKYFTQLSAAAVNPQQMMQTNGRDTSQIVVTNGDLTLAIDPMGREIWNAIGSKQNNWTKTPFASGDIDGDGAPDWVFFEDRDRLELMTALGDRLAVVPVQSALAGFGILTRRPTQTGLLVKLAAGQLVAFGFNRE